MTPYVLVVEDEDALATLLHYNLDKEGYVVGVAGDGEEALTMCFPESAGKTMPRFATIA